MSARLPATYEPVDVYAFIKAALEEDGFVEAKNPSDARSGSTTCRDEKFFVDVTWERYQNVTLTRGPGCPNQEGLHVNIAVHITRRRNSTALSPILILGRKAQTAIQRSAVLRNELEAGWQWNFVNAVTELQSNDWDEVTLNFRFSGATPVE